MSFADIYRGKRVLVTGHTGFKGAWLSEWLLALGADVTGYALPPPTIPSLFDQLGLITRLRHIEGDIRDLSAVCAAFTAARPDFVFHLAAQPLVRLSYEQPTETFAVNVMGTTNILEAVRLAADPVRPCAVVAITTDKCYENREWVHSYREEDPMGGFDPYSASKGAAELVISAYRRSYFPASVSPVHLASARAGNVIGGGDWALDRIVPDCIRALIRGETIPVRNKVATRPWQHVLEPLSGYLWLGACLANPQLSIFSSQLDSAFNFGPALASNRTVAELVQEVLKHWPGQWEDRSDPHAPHEARLLNLATDKAHHFLGWTPAWSFPETIAQTVAWYRQATESAVDLHAFTKSQIDNYTAVARAAGRAWAT
ncbi:CDP-glucose 4,6-dehydratase [Opitutaceae bacterium TAV4]|nr:CDP-glucose 4,6-dehydratase [Opitutaceae bacterium TAV4]RRJ94507.1 CDP-glucose 4,6-dehydratase [Opitutaceae bacterium TAV4]RRJ98569.1 CDP-glucose 4,6-dehydratase [Opitutaceae bacterium TAV3]